MSKLRLKRLPVQPFPMEDRAVYLDRFSSHPDMIDLFSDLAQRRQIAADVFAERWEAALVTVTRLDGVQFFID